MEEPHLGLDDIVDPGYIAWAPNTTNTSEIQCQNLCDPKTPWQAQVCNGHGWEMVRAKVSTACVMRDMSGQKETCFPA